MEDKTIADLTKEVMAQVEEAMDEKQEEPQAEERVPDLQKIYIKNYGNLLLDIIGTNEIGISARSAKRKENLFIPWTSIIMVTKIDGQEDDTFQD